MRRLLLASFLLLIAVFGAQFTFADTIATSTTRASFGGDDLINWGQLGPDGVPLGSTLSVTSMNGLSIAVTVPAGQQNVVCTQSITCDANFAPGDHVLVTEAPGGSMTLSFSSPVSGVGTQFEQNAITSLPFTGVITAFDSHNNLIGSFSQTAFQNFSTPGDNSAPFIGLTDLSGANISSVVFSDVGDPEFGFLINSVSLQVTPVPEPSSLLLLGTGLTSLFLVRRRAKLTH